MTNAQTTSRPKTSFSSKPGGAGSTSGGKSFGGKGDTRGKGGKRPDREKKEPREFDQKILDVARVTAGGKRMSFRCALVIGDRKGRVGFGVAKGADVQIAVDKAYRQAKKNLITVPLVQETLPHAITVNLSSSIIMLKPAPKGSGLKAGGAIRVILEYAGVPNAVSKILNSNNKINIAHATFLAIQSLNDSKK